MSNIRSYTEDILNIYRKEAKESGKEFLYMVDKSHDGYDEDGPQSDLYDLMIWDKNESKIYIYHCEIWFSSSDDDHFYHIETISSKEFFKFRQFLQKDFKDI